MQLAGFKMIPCTFCDMMSTGQRMSFCRTWVLTIAENSVPHSIVSSTLLACAVCMFHKGFNGAQEAEESIGRHNTRFSDTTLINAHALAIFFARLFACEVISLL